MPTAPDALAPDALAPDVPHKRGVPLIQVAAVHAAVAEGFGIDQVLAIEQLRTAQWSEAEVSWKAAMVDDSTVLESYSAHLAQQQDRLGRKVSPVSDDVDAWVSLVAAFLQRGDPLGLMAGLGMCQNDLARLQRGWRRRFEADQRAAKRAAKLAHKLQRRFAEHGEPAELPVISLSDAELTPSIAAGFVPPEPAAELVVPTAPVILGLDQYAALTAELRVVDAAQHDAVLLRYERLVGAGRRGAHRRSWRRRLS